MKIILRFQLALKRFNKNFFFSCDVPFSECVTEAHKPMCICKEEFHGNGTDVCIPMGFETEDNKRGYR